MLLQPFNMTYTYDNSGHGNDGKVKYVANNKMPQQMAFHGAACCLHKCQMVICLWYVRQPPMCHRDACRYIKKV